MIEHVETTGRVQAGRLKIRNRERFQQEIGQVRDGEVVVSVRRVHATRSREANALYWAGYVQPLADWTGYSPQWVHAYLKKRFLTPNHLWIADANGVVVDEADLEPTTTTLNKVEFSNYLHAIEEFALTLGVTVGSAHDVSETPAATR